MEKPSMNRLDAAADPGKLWEALLQEISRRISTPSFETWFVPISGQFMEGNQLKIAATNAFARDWLEDRYEDLFKEILLELTGKEYSIEITTPEEDPIFQIDQTFARQDVKKVKKIDKEAILSYMLLACKEMDLPLYQVKELHRTLQNMLDTHTPEQAKQEGLKFIIQSKLI